MEEDRHKVYTRQDLAVFNLLEHPVYVFDIQNKKMWWANQQAVQLVWNANSLESLLARDFASDMSEASERRMLDYIRRFRVKPNERIHEQWTMYPNGQKITVNESCSGIYIMDDDDDDNDDDGDNDNGGGRQAHLAILTECELGSLEKEVNQAGLRGVEMLRHLPVAVSQFDLDGNLMEQNPEALDLFGGIDENENSSNGWKNTPLLGVQDEEKHQCYDFESSFTRRFVDQELGKQVLQRVRTGSDYQIEAQQHTIRHGECWFAVKVRRSRDPVTGEQIILYSARDISEVIKAKNEADRANMEKSEMLAVLTHEIRTPLHQVVGFIELLGQTTLSGEQADFVRSLQTSTVSLMSIINDVLDYTKLEAGKMEIEEIPFDPRNVCEGCAEVVGPIAQKKGLRFIHDCTKPPYPCPEVVYGDPNRIRQVLLNLLSNGLKFTNTGQVSLHLAMSRNENDDDGGQQQQNQQHHVLKFVVEDTGVGMSPEQMTRIFKKYSQADAAVAREYGGTGLGLAICQALTHAMRGSLRVTSEPGVGSKFTFEVPVRVDNNDRTTPVVEKMPEEDTVSETSSVVAPRSGHLSEVVAPPAATANARILVAEDNEMNRKLMAAILKRGGYSEFTIVENGHLAVEEIEARRCRYDLVLMDVQMPVLDGIEATKRIRSNGWGKASLPVVGLTASFQKADLEFYRDIGMNDCIGKPVRLNELKRIIAALSSTVD